MTNETNGTQAHEEQGNGAEESRGPRIVALLVPDAEVMAGLVQRARARLDDGDLEGAYGDVIKLGELQMMNLRVRDAKRMAGLGEFLMSPDIMNALLDRFLGSKQQAAPSEPEAPEAPSLCGVCGGVGGKHSEAKHLEYGEPIPPTSAPAVDPMR